jgi:hypothetical protein
MKAKGITLRFILSVIAGLATSMALSTITRFILYLCGVFPAPFKPLFDTNLVIIALIYHTLFAMTGAFVTAHFARDRAKKAVIFLGSKEAIMWLLGTIFLWKHSPVWFTITKALIGFPIAMLGGWLYHLYVTKTGKEVLKDESMKIKELLKLLINKFRKKKVGAL